MPAVTREQLHRYLDDTLSDHETARIEQELRQSPALQNMLKTVMQERDRGEHSVGAIWCRNRLSCPTREQLGSYLLGVLDPDFQDYVAFCHANLADLRKLHEEPAPKAQARRRKFFESSAGLLRDR